MERFCIAIAYSQGARSKSVYPLVRSQAFKYAFLFFDHHELAKFDPERILERHWDVLRIIRFRSKVVRIVECARILVEIVEEFGSFAKFLGRFRIPKNIDSPENLECFWKGFDSLRKDLEKRAMPFFRHTTSLLQLLLDLDHDAIKPDLIVMRFCRRLGIVTKEVGDQHFAMPFVFCRSMRSIERFQPVRWTGSFWPLAGSREQVHFSIKSSVLLNRPAPMMPVILVKVGFA